MRLSNSQRSLIRECVESLLGSEVEIFVFGSRLNDSLRGGDVDLMLISPRSIPLAKKLELECDLEDRLGLPVDILVIPPQGPQTAFQHLAIERAQKLPPVEQRI